MASFGNLSPMMGNANQVLGATPTLNQVSQSAPNFQPGLLPPAPQGAMGAPPPQMPSIPGAQPVPSAMPQAPQMPLGQPAQPQGGPVGIPPGNPEAFAIVNALKSRLGSISKSEEMQNGGGQ